MANHTSSDSANWDPAIEKLISMTERGVVEWEPDPKFQPRGEDILVPPAFVANVKGRMVRVYEYEYKYYTDSDDYSWMSGATIEFVDRQGRLEYVWQGSPGVRRRLLDAIRYRAAHVDRFLEELLQE